MDFVKNRKIIEENRQKISEYSQRLEGYYTHGENAPILEVDSKRADYQDERVKRTVEMVKLQLSIKRAVKNIISCKKKYLQELAKFFKENHELVDLDYVSLEDDCDPLEIMEKLAKDYAKYANEYMRLFPKYEAASNAIIYNTDSKGQFIPETYAINDVLTNAENLYADNLELIKAIDKALSSVDCNKE